VSGFTPRAILLLAGRARRLGKLTEHQPKCLVRVAGTSILERALEKLSASGVSEVVLVVGYQAERVREFAAGSYGGMTVRYVFNERYLETNTAYSLWLAREYLRSQVLLLEGDILFEGKALESVHSEANGGSAWAALPVDAERNEGILLESTDAGAVKRVALVREPEEGSPSLTHKCAGIQLLSESAARAFGARLEDTMDDGGTRIFADLVLGEVLKSHPVRLCSLEGIRWAEIDDPSDLVRARAIFAESCAFSQD
jgi:choline kinase